MKTTHTSVFTVMLAALFSVSVAADTAGFRGIPRYVHIVSTTFMKGPASDSNNYLRVCYQFETTIPDFSQKKLMQSTQLPALYNADYIDRAGKAINSEQRNGIELKFKIYNAFNLYAYLNAEKKNVIPENIVYYSSFPRFSNSSRPRHIIRERQSHDYTGLTYPQYEKVLYCEKTLFGKAYSENYIKFFFEQSFAAGYFKSSSKFDVNIFTPPIAGGDKINLDLNHSEYITPVFGKNANINSPINQLIIETAYYMNSVAFLSAQLDFDQINELRAEYADEIAEFEQRFNIVIPSRIDAEVLIDIFEKIGVFMPI